jgi:hypothetical protein
MTRRLTTSFNVHSWRFKHYLRVEGTSGNVPIEQGSFRVPSTDCVSHPGKYHTDSHTSELDRLQMRGCRRLN